MTFYICNRKRCVNCREECRHTSDPAFAVNPKYEDERFMKLRNGDLWEEEPDGSEGLRKYSETVC